MDEQRYYAERADWRANQDRGKGKAMSEPIDAAALDLNYAESQACNCCREGNYSYACGVHEICQYARSLEAALREKTAECERLTAALEATNANREFLLDEVVWFTEQNNSLLISLESVRGLYREAAQLVDNKQAEISRLNAAREKAEAALEMARSCLREYAELSEDDHDELWEGARDCLKDIAKLLKGKG